MNLLKSTTSQIPNSISLASSGVTKQEAFITLLLKLAQSCDFLQYITFVTKNSKVCNIRLSSIQELIWCLLHHWMTIESVAIVASRVDCFGIDVTDRASIGPCLLRAKRCPHTEVGSFLSCWSSGVSNLSHSTSTPRQNVL